MIDIKTGTVYDHYCFIILASATNVHSLHEKKVIVRRSFLTGSLVYKKGQMMMYICVMICPVWLKVW